MSSAVVLSILVIASFIHSTSFDDFDQFFRGFNIFSNVDILALLALSVTLFMKRLELSRALVPVVVTFTMMNLINNPNAVLSYVQVITDLIGMSVALCLLPVMRKTISFASHLVVLLIATSVIGYVFTLNNFS